MCSWSKTLFMAAPGPEGVYPMSGTKDYSSRQPNNKRGDLVSLFKDQRWMGKEKSQQTPAIPGGLEWTGRSPCISPWKAICVFKVALGLQMCSSLLLVVCISRMLWALPLLKSQLLFLASVPTCLCVLELWGKPLIRHNYTAVQMVEGILSASGQTVWLVPVVFVLVHSCLSLCWRRRKLAKDLHCSENDNNWLGWDLAWAFDLFHHDGLIEIVH